MAIIAMNTSTSIRVRPECNRIAREHHLSTSFEKREMARRIGARNFRPLDNCRGRIRSLRLFHGKMKMCF